MTLLQAGITREKAIADRKHVKSGYQSVFYRASSSNIKISFPMPL